MVDKDQGKVKASTGCTKKQQMQPLTTCSQIASNSSPSSATTPPSGLSPVTTTSPKASHFPPPPSMPAGQSPPLTQASCFTSSSHHVVPLTPESPHSPAPIPPENEESIDGPNDTQDDESDIETSGSKQILNLDGDGFLPSHLAANSISDIFKRHYVEAWPSWKKIPSKTRDKWFAKFMRKYSISPHDPYWAQNNFEKRGAALLKNALQKARKNMKRPSWLKVHVWNGLCTHWEGEAFKKVSAQAKKNRASDCGGLGVSRHTGGSITTSQHRANLTRLNGVAPSPSSLFRHTHQRKDKTWVDKRSAHIADAFAEKMQHSTQKASEKGGPPPNELDVWCDVAGVRKGRIYGLGLESTVVAGRPQYRGSSSSSSEWVRKEELEELRNERDRLRIRLERRLENNEMQIERTNQLVRELVRRMKSQPLHSFSLYEQFLEAVGEEEEEQLQEDGDNEEED